MSQTTKTLTLDKVRQLVDLNGELTNFVARFIITPKTDAPYEYTIASQTMLDNSETLNFLPAKGPVQKEFSIEEDLYQNHFLVLKSNSPHEVDIIIQREALPSKVVANPAATAQAVVVAPQPVEPPFYKQTWFQLLMVCAAIAVGYYLYNKYFSKKVDVSPSSEVKKYNFSPAPPPRYPTVNLSVEKSETLPEVPLAVSSVSIPVSTPTPAPTPEIPTPPVVVAPAPVVTTPGPVEVVTAAPKASSPKDFTSMLLKKLKNSQTSSR